MTFKLIKRPGKKTILALCVVGLAVIVLAVLELTNTTHLLHHQKEKAVVSGAFFNTKGEKKSSKSSGANKPDKQGGLGSGSAQATPPSTAALYTPTGDFVSNHHPNLGGSPAPNTVSSVCNTTPGATCKITFTKDGVTKELASRTTDANGSAYWSWKLQDIGLTVGTWKVQAVASLNGQIKSASDAMDLVIAQ